VKVWRDLVKDKWWTKADLTSAADGKAITRGYFGWYDITIEHGGKTKSFEIKHAVSGSRPVVVSNHSYDTHRRSCSGPRSRQLRHGAFKGSILRCQRDDFARFEIPITCGPTETPMNIQTKSWQLPRRTFLRGMGATLALPLLDAMLPCFAATAPKRAARRMVCVYSPNGVNVWQWFPKQGAPFAFTPTLKPLEALKEHLTVIAGLHHPAMKLGEGHNGANTWLTGADVSATPGVEFLNTISADQIAAEIAAAETRFASLELSAEPGGGGAGGRARTLSWTANGVALPSTSTLADVYRKLFEPDDQKSVADRKKATDAKRSLLDTILGSAKRLDQRLGTEDRRKLDEYLTSVREVEKRVERSHSWLGVPKPKPGFANEADRKNFEHGVGSLADDPVDYFPALYDLMFLALQSDSTRVITMMTGSEGLGITLRELGISTFHHGLSHHNHDKQSLADLARTDRFLVEQHARFIQRLQDTPEASGTLLDSTIVLYGSGMSDAHNTRHLPIVLAGGKNLGFRHRQWLDLSRGGRKVHIDTGFEVEVNDKARMSNLLLTMLQSQGAEIQKFADSTGTLSDLWSA